jgi:hypothetical protein
MFLGRDALLKLKLRAMRKGVWFRALPRIDRVLIEATLRVTDNVRSLVLMKSLCAVAKKLEILLEDKLLRATREFGFPLAQKLGAIAQEWGNKSARDWSLDFRFARFLATLSFNGHLAVGK